MAKKTIRYANDHQAELGKMLRNVGYRHGLWQVFRDFVAMSAFAISNAVDHRNFADREAEYLKIVSRYTKDEANEIARGLALVVLALEDGLCDFLGSLFMSLELGDAWKGQYFTPYEVSRMMALMTIGDKTQSEIERKGFVTVCDPCIGGGALVIAAAHAMQDTGINYQQHMHAVAVDVDIVSVHMAYIQLSLLHIPAVIYHGNSLSMKMWSQWRTPAHVLGFWDSKLRRADEPAPVIQPETNAAKRPELVKLNISIEAILAVLVEQQDEPQNESQQSTILDTFAPSINLRDQMALF